MPLDGKRDRSVAENAEVVAVVRVFPDVLAIEHEVLAEGLLEAGMEFIAKARTQRSERVGRAEREADSRPGLAQPMLESTRFSLNGVSRVRA